MFLGRFLLNGRNYQGSIACIPVVTDWTAASRRRVLQTLGTALTAGSLAGCAALQQSSTPATTDEPEERDNGDFTPGEAGEIREGSGSGDAQGGRGDGSVTSPLLTWLEPVDNFGGPDEIKNFSGQNDVVVKVGVGNGPNGNVGFGPPAIKVDPGTTITWEWTGEGGEHSVTEGWVNEISNSGSVPDDNPITGYAPIGSPEFESKLTAEPGFTFSWTYDSDSWETVDSIKGDPLSDVRYYCSNHMGVMRGLIEEAD